MRVCDGASGTGHEHAACGASSPALRIEWIWILEILPGFVFPEDVPGRELAVQASIARAAAAPLSPAREGVSSVGVSGRWFCFGLHGSPDAFAMPTAVRLVLHLAALLGSFGAIWLQFVHVLRVPLDPVERVGGFTGIACADGLR